MKQGLGEANMIGQSVFSKYYSAKMKLVFPSEKPIGDHFKAQIIWGWMTAPFNLKNSNTGTGDPFTRGDVTEEYLNTVLLRTVQDGFNQNVDQVNVRDKEKTLYRVEGKRWVKPDRRHEIGFPQSMGLEQDEMDPGKVVPVILGAPPAYTMRFSSAIRWYSLGSVPMAP